MPTNFDAHPFSIGSLLGTDQRKTINLPRFQRGYSWQTGQLAKFWGDLYKFKTKYESLPTSATYFMGPIVICDDNEKYYLLDGQQRLATATIFLACIRDIANKIAGPDGRALAHRIQQNYILKGEDETTFSLTLGELDDDYFTENVKKFENGNTTKAKLRSHKLITNAKTFFCDKLNNEIKDKIDKEQIIILKKYYECLTKGVLMVAIMVTNEMDAYYIFETLNDRGLRLSIPDLLLNLLMRESKNDNEKANIRQKWNSMLQVMGARDSSRFFRHMWLSKYGDLKAQSLFDEIKNKLDALSITTSEFAEDCSSECDNYFSLIDNNGDYEIEAKDNLEGLIKYFNNTSCMPLLLSGNKCLSKGDFSKLVKAIVTLIIRYSVISNLNPDDLENAFYEAARDIRGKNSTGNSSAKCLSSAKQILNKINPPNSILRENIKELEVSRKEAIWLLKNIAIKLQSKTKETGLNRVSLEHIYPLNPDTDEWPNHKELESYAWYLGNLTILSKEINRDAKNKGFINKRDNYYKKSELKINESLNEYKQWDKESIVRRAEEYCDQIIKIWPET